MEWVLTFLIVFGAALVQSSTGFGFAILAIPLLMLIHDVRLAITMTIMLSLVSSLTTLPKVYKEIDKQLLKKLGIGSMIGLPLGGVLFFLVDVVWLKLAVSATILLFTLPLLLKWRLPLGNGSGVGMLSGLLTSSIGMPGPPIVVYMTSKQVGKGPFRATSIAYYCLVYPISLAIQLFSGQIAFDMLGIALWMIPAVFLGQAAGGYIHTRISQEWFRRITFALLIMTALNAMLEYL